MSKREVYDGIVAEVEEDIDLIQAEYPTSYEEAVTSTTMTITLHPDGVSLKTPISAFSDYAVRDTIMAKAMEDERFALVLTMKIGKYVESKVEENNPIVQDDIEALTMVSQIVTLWEQFDLAEHTLALVGQLTEKYDLTVPNLANLTMGFYNKRQTFDFAKTRAEVVAELKPKCEEALGE